MQDISISPFDSSIYASTGRTLYRSDDKGNNWRAVFFGQGEDSVINFTGISEKGIFICAENGVFKSDDGKLTPSEDKALNWKRISEENAGHIAFSKDGKILLDTMCPQLLNCQCNVAWQHIWSLKGF